MWACQLNPQFNPATQHSEDSNEEKSSMCSNRYPEDLSLYERFAEINMVFLVYCVGEGLSCLHTNGNFYVVEITFHY